MCGIAGFNWQDKTIIEMMSGALKHRGPDDEGFYIDSRVSLAHRRLSVIDTSERGHQPMEFKNLTITYNGEVYNYKELREQLKSKGYHFNSDTDTEVVLYGYHQWGPSCVNRFNGMWAFCIYDKEKNTLFLSRDRFGIKPLYYYFDGNQFIFASELKAIKKHKLDFNINLPALNFFFYQKYIGKDLTIFNHCYKLEPSENLMFELRTKRLIRTKYYNLEGEISKCQNIPLRGRIESIEGTIIDAVEERLVADVPVGSFLSGGIDSSLISAIIGKSHRDFDSFSIGFKDKSYNELRYSKMVSEYIYVNHHYDYLEINENIIKFIIENMDEPFGDSSLLPTCLLSKMARRKVTVSLCGDGGDEVFGGYDTYQAYKIARYLPRAVRRLSKSLIDLLPSSDENVPLTFKMKRFVRNYEGNINRRHLNWMATFTDLWRGKLLKDNFVSAESFINCSCEKNFFSIQLNDIHNYLVGDILKKVDFASMLNSLEVRVPFLDHRLVPLVLSLPEKYKIKGLTTKWLLKKIASTYLPKEIVHRSKKGFVIPISRWIKKSDLIRGFLTSRRYYQHNLLSYDYVQQLFNVHINNREDTSRELWLVFVFNYWWYQNG